MDSSTERLAQCDVCSEGDSIYTCPKCGVKTCCLKCVNSHKKEMDCDGVRDKTKFVYLQKFTNLDLLSDYKLLEESSRFIINKRKNSDKRFTSFNRDLPIHLYKLKCAARKRGTILLFLLENFNRHKINSTRLNYKSGKIFWHIEWIFVNAYPQPVKLFSEKCDESTRLAKILNEYFNPAGKDINICDSLVYYSSAGLSGCRILLQAERIKNSSRKFYELDSRLSLKENIAGKCIIEFPIIYVVLKDHSYDFDTVNSDDEIEELHSDENATTQLVNEVKHRDTFTNTFSKEKRKQIECKIADSKKKEPKSFFFKTNEYSSEEEEEN